MEVIIKDIQKLVPTLSQSYLHRYVKPTGQYKLMNGWLHSLFNTNSIRVALEEKRHIGMTSTRLCTKHRETSLRNIRNILNAINILEGIENEK